MSLVKLLFATIILSIAWGSIGSTLTNQDLFRAVVLLLAAFILRKEKDE